MEDLFLNSSLKYKKKRHCNCSAVKTELCFKLLSLTGFGFLGKYVPTLVFKRGKLFLVFESDVHGAFPNFQTAYDYIL